MEKQFYCIYDPYFTEESSVGALRIYIKTEIGYINYNIAHARDAECYADNWRLSFAYACDSELLNPFALNPGAEWDMALMIKDRNDFIGGELHGDEVFNSLSLTVDGEARDLSSIEKLTEFETISFKVSSVGYDPSDHVSAALLHKKEYTVTAKGLTLAQRVEWLNDYELKSCYMAMMPPLKQYVDHFFTDVDPEPKRITESDFEIPNCSSATFFGEESGLSFKMSVPIFKRLSTGGMLLVSDNGGRPYNKMYFPVCYKSGAVKLGDVWETVTEYEISRNKPCVSSAKS